MGLNFETFQTKMSYYFWINNKNASATTNSKMAFYWTVFKCLSYWGFFICTHKRYFCQKGWVICYSYFLSTSQICIFYCCGGRSTCFTSIIEGMNKPLFLQMWTQPFFKCLNLLDQNLNWLIKEVAQKCVQSQPYWGFKSATACSWS